MIPGVCQMTLAFGSTVLDHALQASRSTDPSRRLYVTPTRDPLGLAVDDEFAVPLALPRYCCATAFGGNPGCDSRWIAMKGPRTCLTASRAITSGELRTEGTGASDPGADCGGAV
jgi:hypothetical protein